MKPQMNRIEIDRSKIEMAMPSRTVFDSYIAALHEGFYRGSGEPKTAEEIAAISADFDAHLAALNAPPDGTITAPSGDRFPMAPYENLWLVCGDVFIGEFSFRHALTAFLEKVGGHVGYGIRPALAGQGLGTLGLGMIRKRAADMGIERLLLTCRPDNQASEKIITKNGGIYQDTLDNPYDFGPVKRYWVPVSG